jgi:hypothetical protein
MVPWNTPRWSATSIILCANGISILLEHKKNQQKPRWSFNLVDDSERTGATSPSATTAAPDLLPHQRLPPHRICLPIDDYHCTGSGTSLMTLIAPDLPQHQWWPQHCTASTSSMRSYLDDWQWSNADAPRQEVCKIHLPSMLLARDTFIHGSGLEVLVGLHSTSKHEYVINLAP